MNLIGTASPVVAAQPHGKVIGPGLRYYRQGSNIFSQEENLRMWIASHGIVVNFDNPYNFGNQNIPWRTYAIIFV